VCTYASNLLLSRRFFTVTFHRLKAPCIHSTSGRFFDWKIGGALPAAIAAINLCEQRTGTPQQVSDALAAQELTDLIDYALFTPLIKRS